MPLLRNTFLLEMTLPAYKSLVLQILESSDVQLNSMFPNPLLDLVINLKLINLNLLL